MAIPIRDTAPIQGVQAEELFELLYGEELATNAHEATELTLAPSLISKIRELAAAARK